MSHIFRRLHSIVSTATATATAAQFLSKYASQAPFRQSQLLDSNQLQRLSATLSRSPASISSIKEGTAIPACYHLAYFSPCQLEAELGADGTDTTFNPPAPFTRRMWAGGELEWSRGGRLRVGETVRETTKLVSAVGKRTKAGEEMVVVGVEKSFENEEGAVLIDKRNWIFRPEITTPLPPTPRPLEVPLPTGTYTRDFLQTPVSLFRFSALTFNGHKIHYNREWCRDVEGHRDLVVHGPLNLINIVDFWRDVKGGECGGEAVLPRKVVYRATSPLYAGERYRIAMDGEQEGRTEVRIVDSFGKIAMVATIESA